MRNVAKLLVFLVFLGACEDDPSPPEPDAAVTATNENMVPDLCLGDDCPDGGP